MRPFLHVIIICEAFFHFIAIHVECRKSVGWVNATKYDVLFERSSSRLRQLGKPNRGRKVVI